MYEKTNKVHFFQLVPRPISTVKEGYWVAVIHEEEIFIGKVANVVNGQVATQSHCDCVYTVYYKTVYYFSIWPKIVKVGGRWKWHRCDGALISGFGHTLMDLYQSLHFELFPCIIYIYTVENILLTSYFKCLYSLCAKSNSAAYNMIFTSLCCVIALKIILCVIKFLFRQLMTS